MSLSLAAKISSVIDAVNEWLGGLISWLTLMMVLLQFAVVLMRYVFGIGAVVMQEAIVYMHALVFIIGAGFTLLHDGHVRVDIFYRPASERQKALIDLIGVLVLLLPVCILIFWTALPFVTSAWVILEGSPEASGIQAVYLLKSIILAYAILLFLQGLSLALKSLLVLTGLQPPLIPPGISPGHQDPHSGGARDHDEGAL